MLDRATASHSLGETLGLGRVTARELYTTLDWLGSEQAFIENSLARRHLKNGMLGALRCHLDLPRGPLLSAGPPRLQPRRPGATGHRAAVRRGPLSGRGRGV